MVLSILIAAIVAPGLLGSQEAIRQSQSKEKREEHRARRCNLIATCVKSSARSREINGRQVVLRNGKLWIDAGTPDGSPLGHPYAGYYLPYPDTKYEGLVTTITDVAPIMNWVYIDKTTCEAKYGVRADAQPNLTGPFDCTRQDRRLTFDGWEGWCAVEEAPGLWGLYFDLFDDGLKSVVQPGTRVLEVELGRKEKRFQKEADARLGDQTTKREVDAQEEAPVERPLGGEALVEKPGVFAHGEESNEVAGGERTDGGDDGGWLKPLKIPKSIFEDPPPVIGGMVFSMRTPKTPPPAYERVDSEEEEAVQPVQRVESNVVSAEDSNEQQENTTSFAVEYEQLPRVEEDPGSVQSQSMPIYEIPISPDKPDSPPAEPDGRPDYEIPASPDKPDSPKEKPQLKSIEKTSDTPPAERQTTPTSEKSISAISETLFSQSKPGSPRTATSPPATQQTTPKSEKRATPKLNRNSGTRALAQAQLFEALAAGQLPREEVQKRLTQRGSRASSNTSSLYSIEDEAFNAPVPSKTPELSPTPPQLEIPQQEKVLPASRETSATPEPPSGLSVQQPVTPPRQRAPSMRADPAAALTRSVSSARSLPRRPNEGRGAVPPFPVTPAQRPVSQRSATPSSNRLRDRNASPQLSSPRPDASRESPRSLVMRQRDRDGPERSSVSRQSMSRESPGSATPSSNRQADRSTSSQSTSRPDTSRRSPRSSTQSVVERLSSTPTRLRVTERSSPRPDASSKSPRFSPQVGPSRPSLARTMTSGRANQGMSSRLGGSVDMGNVVLRPEDSVQGRPRAGTVGRKTTSILLKELDDLVGMEGGGGGQRR
ncbi:hypothetical protein PtrSN002B_005311 [Pyrenophora tritici-repentis]|nr:hypothetical protein Alg215_05347 [Pyrenophora tritici-repentis]KAI1537583.1 hypothetical protein PtrSN001A_005229 [Pyrenophora tritici-repentis]KAI1552111.1 hypothetical protein PtrSN002B_005311 [Pyrenophora tritici-repentis]KAI1569010.1 hypothetical protein PtrEW4_006126 [Pyrenophora tritici-repentis]KAI1591345.1 hypothetical protein PtrEW13061_004652 [Pyrenophora tritici-repentis]